MQRWLRQETADSRAKNQADGRSSCKTTFRATQVFRGAEGGHGMGHGKHVKSAVGLLRRGWASVTTCLLDSRVVVCSLREDDAPNLFVQIRDKVKKVFVACPNEAAC